MKKFLLVILTIFAGLFLTACEDFDLNGMLGDMGLGGSSSAKFSINEELLEGNHYTISIQMKKIKAKSEFETDEDYQKYLNDTVDSIEKKLLRDATLKGNEEIISASIDALLATIQSCGSEEEILAAFDAFAFVADKTFASELAKLNEPYLNFATRILMDAEELPAELEINKEELVDKFTKFSSTMKKDLTEEEYIAAAQEIIDYIEETHIIDYFIESVVKFIVEVEWVKTPETLFVDGIFNTELLNIPQDATKEAYKVLGAEVVISLIYETEKVIVEKFGENEELSALVSAEITKLASAIIEDVESTELQVKLLEICANLEAVRLEALTKEVE